MGDISYTFLLGGATTQFLEGERFDPAGRQKASSKALNHLNLLTNNRCAHNFQKLFLAIRLEIKATVMRLWIPMFIAELLLTLTLNRCKCELLDTSIVRTQLFTHPYRSG
jgi:hypothetical protein